MNLNIFCSAIISKKLAKICKDNILLLAIQPAEGEKMTARLRITCPDNVKMEDIKKIEDISIMLEINSISEDTKDLESETPIQNLYTSAEKINNAHTYDAKGAMKGLAITD